MQIYFHPGWGYLLPHLLASLFYVHSLVYHQISTINYVAWSLEVEIQFYLLVPALALLFAITHASVRRAVLLVCICVAGFVQMQPWFPQEAWLTILGHIQFFLAGFLLADLLAARGDASQKHWLWDVASLVLWPMVYWMPHNWPLSNVLLPLIFCAIYMAAFLGPGSNRCFRTQWVAVAGGMCYSTYLLHPLVIDTGFKFTSRLLIFQDFLINYGLQVLLLGVAIALVSAAFYIWVERPCMDPNWPQALLRRLRRAKTMKTA